MQSGLPLTSDEILLVSCLMPLSHLPLVPGTPLTGGSDAPGQARRVAALAFMHMVMGWEDLVEATFIRYLVGAKSPSGWSPRLRLGPASRLDHAYKLHQGPAFRRGSDYLNWSNWGAMSSLSEGFLRRRRTVFYALTSRSRSVAGRD